MKKKVLIADAGEQFRNELAAALENNEEFEVIGVAADGQEALEMALENQPDIVVLDLLLPQYDGIHVLDLIFARYGFYKAVVVTGFVSDYIISALAKRGVSALLKKPCSVQCVIDRIKEELQRENLFDEGKNEE